MVLEPDSWVKTYKDLVLDPTFVPNPKIDLQHPLYSKLDDLDAHLQP